MVYVNPSKLITDYLIGKTTAGSRVYGEGLPPSDFFAMDSVIIDQLQGTITVDIVPGFIDQYLPFQYPRLYIRCYNTDKPAALGLFFELVNALNNVTIDGATGRIVMYLNGGPNCDVDKDTKFCYAEGYFAGALLGRTA